MLRKAVSAISLLILILSTTGLTVRSVQAGYPERTTQKGQCTVEQGQVFINEGRYKDAIRVFSCVIDNQPTEIEGYRGRIEAALLLGRFSDAVRDYTRVTAYVLPVHPDAETAILDYYADRLAASPTDVPAIMGASFARWYFFDYPQAIHLLNQLLDLEPENLYANLFRGSSRLLKGVTQSDGIADLEVAISLAPESPDVRFIVADAYTYGLPDPQRAFYEASLALEGGLNTPRVHAILAGAYLAFGDDLSAAEHLYSHIEMVTAELVTTSPLASGGSLTLDQIPGRTYEIPLEATAGQEISITTSSLPYDIWDSILVVLAPDGTPVMGSDDYLGYLAGFEGWVAGETGTYRLWVTTFESVSTGTLVVQRE